MQVHLLQHGSAQLSSAQLCQENLVLCCSFVGLGRVLQPQTAQRRWTPEGPPSHSLPAGVGLHSAAAPAALMADFSSC